MAGAQVVAHRQEVLRAHRELTQVVLRGQIILQEMARKWLCQVLHSLFATAHLHCVDSVLLLGLDLRYLASVDLDDCAGHVLPPLVPIVSHSNFVADQSTSCASSSSWGSFHKTEISINFIFKARECFDFSLNTMDL